MLEKVKKWVKDHETELKIAGGIVGGIIIGYKVKTILNKEGAKEFFKKNTAIVWPTNPNKSTLDQVKEILDANANNTASFAIFRETCDPNAFDVVRLTQDLVIPDSFK